MKKYRVFILASLFLLSCVTSDNYKSVSPKNEVFNDENNEIQNEMGTGKPELTVPILEDVRGIVDPDDMIELLNNLHEINMNGLRLAQMRAKLYNNSEAISKLSDYFNRYYNFLRHQNIEIEFIDSWRRTILQQNEDDERNND